MEILTKKICESYQNLPNFCKEEGLSLNVVNSLRKKKGNYFRTGSKAFKAYKRLKALGFIKEEDQEVA